MTTTIEITEQQLTNAFTDRLKIKGAESEHEALHAAETWCSENESYHENIAWKEDEICSKDGDTEEVYYVRVCRNDYK